MRTLLFSATLAAALVPASAALADDGAGFQSLLNESVVSTASQVAETSSMAPATSVVITADELRLFGIEQVGEVFKLLAPGTTSLETPHSTENAVRGVAVPLSSGAHVLWLLNGHRLNEEFRHGPLAELPIELVDHVEIVLGPGSVLYGSNAMQAVVNIITKDARTSTGVRVGFESRLPHSGRPVVDLGSTFELFGSRGGVVAGAQYHFRDGPAVDLPVVSLGGNPATGRPLRTTSAAIPTGLWGGRAEDMNYLRAPSGFVQLTLGELKLDVHAQIAKRSLTADGTDFDEPGSSYGTRALHVDLSHARRLSAVVEVTERLYFDATGIQIQHQSSRAPYCMKADATCFTRIDGASTSGGAELRGRFDWLKDGSFVTTVGVDGRIRRVRSRTDYLDAFSGEPISASSGVFDRLSPAAAAYAQHVWEPLRWLGLNVGARLDADPRFAPVVSPRETLRLKPWEGGTIRLVHANAFRAPSFYESDFANPLAPVNPDLAPERVTSYEASFEQRVGTHLWSIGVFRNAFKDLISFHPLSSAQQNDYLARAPSGALPPLYQHLNVARITAVGFDLSYSGALLHDRLKYTAQVTAVNARFEEAREEEPLAGAPPIYGNARVSYDLGRALPTVGVVASFYARTLAQRAFDGHFRPVPYAPPQLEPRLVVAGRVPGIPKLSYRGYVATSFADRSPVLVGPLSEATAANPSPVLMPIDRFRAFAGLHYEF